MNDLFWKKKYADYAAGFGIFSKLMKESVPDITQEDIFHHWLHFLQDICDCEGCRDDETCVIEIDIDDADYVE
tara:strand:- start:3218 stop:3436 length:219 start_codon:yes stop_codon:yes gene_type:complete